MCVIVSAVEMIKYLAVMCCCVYWWLSVSSITAGLLCRSSDSHGSISQIDKLSSCTRYGKGGMGEIPGNQALVFRVTLLGVNK